MAAITLHLWYCLQCGREVMTHGCSPSRRYDDGCRSAPLAEGRFGDHAWSEADAPAGEESAGEDAPA